jgi:anti-sigma B factor antagonist
MEVSAVSSSPQVARQVPRRVRTVQLSGELDVATAPAEFHRVVEERPDAGDVVKLDLGQVTFIDSSGIAMLLKTKAYLEGGGCALVLTDLSPAVQHVFAILGLDDSFSMESDASPTHTS